MNKARVDQLITYAYKAIRDNGISNDKNEVRSTFRSQISTFGASIAMGSLKAAIAFFSNQGSSSVDRSKLPEAILQILQQAGTVPANERSLYFWAEKEISSGRETACREEIVNAAIAVKLAMNLYTLVK